MSDNAGQQGKSNAETPHFRGRSVQGSDRVSDRRLRRSEAVHQQSFLRNRHRDARTTTPAMQRTDVPGSGTTIAEICAIDVMTGVPVPLAGIVIRR
jgi:hypothetical protein